MTDDTYECTPTLTDQQVTDFRKNGFLILEAVVPDEVNRQTLSFLDEYPSMDPVEILNENWFVENVIKNRGQPSWCPVPIFFASSAATWPTMAPFAKRCEPRRRPDRFSLPTTRSGTVPSPPPAVGSATCSSINTGAQFRPNATGGGSGP